MAAAMNGNKFRQKPGTKLTHKEIAEILGVTKFTVQNDERRAFRKIRAAVMAEAEAPGLARCGIGCLAVEGWDETNMGARRDSALPRGLP